MLPDMTETNAVPGFLPSVNGLHFANRFESGPTVRLGFIDPRWVGVGDASAGLCGGMSWFVRERFEAGVHIPGDRVAPPNGSPLFKAIVRRQVLSLDWLRGPLRFWIAAARGSVAAARRTRDVEWPKAKAAIDAGHLPMLGLIRHSGVEPLHADQGPPGPRLRLRDGRPDRLDHDPDLRPQLARPRRHHAHHRCLRPAPELGRAAARVLRHAT